MSGAAGTILSVDGLSVRFDVSSSPLARLLSSTGKRVVHAVEDVSFRVEKGTTFALVGESGCGKTTIARTIVGIQVPTSGSISFMGRDVTRPGRSREARKDRRNIQMIFQDPYSSLNPRWRVGRIIAEPIVTHGLEESRNVAARVGELLELVGLSRSDANKFPHQFSGGQRQRVAIARALASNPAFIVCDEPTSALDVSVQAQILNLMRKLQRQFDLTYLLISHNLAVVAHMADTLGVMYLGRLVEQGTARTILTRPLHPYTQLLLDTIPSVAIRDRERQPLSGEVPSPIDPPSGCAFHPRCPYARERCRTELPAPRLQGGVWVACHGVEEGWIGRSAEPCTRSTLRAQGR